MPAAQAQTYLEYIGTNLTDRSCAEAAGHDAAVEWITGELENAGYTGGQILQNTACS